MNFGEHLKAIADNFERARSEPFGKHPLAELIRNGWPKAFREMLGKELAGLNVDASPGLGQWSGAPWLAVLHPDVTHSARAGFYPVYLFEPGFKTVCLVLGQGAETLTSAVGKKVALRELEKRAGILRSHVKPWPQGGFNTGPFITRKSAARGTGDDGARDPWSVSVAVGKRYYIDSLPADVELRKDALELTNIYRAIAPEPELRFAHIDQDLEDLKESGELPKGGTVDGAVRVSTHKQIERRNRNPKLIKEVKKKLGYTCQACKLTFAAVYGDLMAGYIEAHHKVPISSLPETGALLKPTADDFMVLCSNCHRAIHRAGCPDLDEFTKLVKKLG